MRAVVDGPAALIMAPNAPEAIALGFSDDVLPALLKSPSRSRGLRRALSDRQNAGVMVDEEDIYDPEAAPTVVDLEETPHDTSVTLENRPQVARVPTPVALERLVGLGGTREEASVAGRPSTSETDRAARTSEARSRVSRATPCAWPPRIGPVKAPLGIRLRRHKLAMPARAAGCGHPHGGGAVPGRRDVPSRRGHPRDARPED